MINTQQKLMLNITFNMATTQSNSESFAMFHKFKCKIEYRQILVLFLVFILGEYIFLFVFFIKTD